MPYVLAMRPPGGRLCAALDNESGCKDLVGVGALRMQGRWEVERCREGLVLQEEGHRLCDNHGCSVRLQCRAEALDIGLVAGKEAVVLRKYRQGLPGHNNALSVGVRRGLQQLGEGLVRGEEGLVL